VADGAFRFGIGSISVYTGPSLGTALIALSPSADAILTRSFAAPLYNRALDAVQSNLLPIPCPKSFPSLPSASHLSSNRCTMASFCVYSPICMPAADRSRFLLASIPLRERVYRSIFFVFCDKYKTVKNRNQHVCCAVWGFCLCADACICKDISTLVSLSIAQKQNNVLHAP